MNIYQPVISGSLTVTGSTTFIGNITINSGSLTMTSGSLTGTASLASNSLLLQGTGSIGFATTASLLEVSSSQQQISSSLLQVSASYISLSGSYTTFSGSASTIITANSSSIQQVSSSQQQISSSLLNVIANYATTGSNSFRADQSITGSLVVSSTITAQTLVVQTVTSSIVYSSGSNNFGNQLANTQTFTGSVNITGSLTVATTGTEFQVTNAGVKIGNVIGDAHSITGSVNVSGSSTTIGTASFQTSGNNGVINLGGNTYYGQVKVDSNLGGIQINSIWGGANSGIIQLTNGTAGNVRLHIADNGNVGIGTVNPNSTLQVSKNGATFQVTDTGKTADNTFSVYGLSQTSWAIATGNSGSFSGGEKIVLLDNGNIGIGNTNPGAKLEIQSTRNSTILRLTATSGENWEFKNTNTVGSTDVLSIGAAGATANLNLVDNGNVGIGTSAPVTLLQVSGSSTDNLVFVNNTNANGYGSVRCANNGNKAAVFGVGGSSVGAPYADTGYIYTDSGVDLTFSIGGSQKMRITTGGTIQTYSGTTLYGEIYIGGTAMVINGYNGDLNLQTSGANRLKINSSGWIGIDRTATANRLEVNGDASKTSAGSWLANSDINIKTYINTIEGALDRINKVRLVSFKYKDAYKEANNSIKDKFYHNVIAQEFQEIYPDYVYDSGDVFEDHKVLQVDTNPMYIDSVSAIQELSKIVQEQQVTITSLQAQITELKNK
jgi:hypothetical protein